MVGSLHTACLDCSLGRGESREDAKTCVAGIPALEALPRPCALRESYACIPNLLGEMEVPFLILLH